MVRQIVIYSDYFPEFYELQTDKVKDKIDYVLDLIRFIERVPVKYQKHITGYEGLYEIRIATSFKNIRIFCFFDKGKLIVLTNCFVKKTRKTPKKEIKLALKLKQEYQKINDE